MGFHWCRCVRSPVTRSSRSSWMDTLSMRPGTVAEHVRDYDLSGGASAPRGGGGSSGMPSPVRAVVAQRSIARGERICRVPAPLVLTGERAAHYLEALRRSASTTLASTTSASASASASTSTALQFDEIRKSGVRPDLLASRDGLLVMSLLYAWRSPRYRDAAALRVEPHLQAWMRTLPTRTPPLGLLLHTHLGGRAEHTPLSRRLSLGESSVLLESGADVKSAATELMVAAVEQHGLEALRTPSTETVLTPSMRTDYYKGRRTALTQRQHEAAASQTLRPTSSASMKQLISLESDLQEQVIRPALGALTPSNDGSLTASELDEYADDADIALMQWAHFTMRSRAVNLLWRQQNAAQLAVVPFLDRLNHASGGGANVVYHCEEDGGVAVTASKAIRSGEELTMDYGSATQRGCLFGVDAAAASASEAAMKRADRVLSEVRAIERRQKYEMIDEDTAATAEQSAPAVGEMSEAAAEVQWLWRYGFMRSAEERAEEAQQRWGGGLRKRIAHLTDVRRRGRPGEFVIGVPEGLHHLREQREELERVRYNNTRVFPPQRD